MKKSAVVVLFALIWLPLQAQKNVPETRHFQVANYTGIETSGIVHVVVEKADEYALSIETYPEVFPYLDVQVKNGILRIGLIDGGLPKSIHRKYRDLKVLCKVKLKDLNRLQTCGVAKIYVRDSFYTKEMKIELSGVSEIDIQDVECNVLDIEISGVSELSVYGKTEELQAEISGASKGYFYLEGKTITFANVVISGTGKTTLEGEAIKALLNISGTSEFEGARFKVETMKAGVSGVSRARVHVTGSLDPTLSGASKLYYNRNALLRNINISGASQLNYY
jgi:hypothetical protein